MGEPQGWLFEPSFNRTVKVQATDHRITSDGGLLLLREADHRLGITEHLAALLEDPRRPELIRYELVELLRERLYSLSMGYCTQDDVDRLAHDPAMKMAVWNRRGEQPLDERLASQPTQSRLIDILTRTPGNRAALRDSLADCCERHLRATGGDHAARKVTVDIDSFPIAVHGHQPGAAYNGYYHDTVYHPLVASYSVAGDYDSMNEGHRLGNGFLHAILRAGQAVRIVQGDFNGLQQFSVQQHFLICQTLDVIERNPMFGVEQGLRDNWPTVESCSVLRRQTQVSCPQCRLDYGADDPGSGVK